MDNYKTKKTTQTPEISLNAITGDLSFLGRSLPEDSSVFYKPVFSWLDEYTMNPAKKTSVIFGLDYFNTASAKAIFSIIVKLDKLSKNNHQININWLYDEDDEDMKELGEEYQDLFSIPLELIANKDE